MKLALIRRQFSATGGAELYVQRLLTALASAGHEPHLFAESWDGAAGGVTLHRVPVSGSRAEKPARFAHAVEDAMARESFDCVFSLERTLKQDVYRAGDGVHRVWLERRRQFAPWWKRPFIGRGAFHRNMMAIEAQTFDPANTRRIIVNSEMVKREILEHFKFPSERIHLVRNGVDVERFRSGKRAETRARFGVNDDEFLLLFVGSGWERKGLRYLIEAMRSLPATTRLLVVGKGTPPAGSPPTVIFASSMTDVEHAFAAADLFAFVPVYEPSANVCAEALAAGLPVVTCSQNGAAEWIREGVNGTVLPTPDDIPALVRAIMHWSGRDAPASCPDVGALGLDRNVAETLAILELATREKRA